MANAAVEAHFNQLLTSIADALKPYGYRKRGKSFRLARNGNVALIEFQRSMSSDAHAIKFTVNLGVLSAELLHRWDPEREIAKVGVFHAHLRARIGEFLPNHPDRWWMLTDAGLIDPEGELLSLLVSYVVPFLAEYTSDADLLALWKTGDSPGLTEMQRLQNIEQLEDAAQKLA